MDTNQLTDIFCQVDDFCKTFDGYVQAKLLPKPKTSRGPQCCLSEAEIMTIIIAFQNAGYRNFKTFYIGHVGQFWKKAFPTLPSYNRFIELMQRVFFHLIIFSQVNSGKRTDIYYIDSSCLPVCHSKRRYRHKTFKGIAASGRSSVGWFFGLKIHLVINHIGQLIAFKLTRGNVSDVAVSKSLLQGLSGLAFGDKGYIGKTLSEHLLKNGVKLVTRVRKNMKTPHYSSLEKHLLDKPGIIETVINHFKNHYFIWHTRHRSIINAFTHLIAAIAAYSIAPLKISANKATSC